MRIIELQAENVKGIKAVAIAPTGPIVQITGPNGSGKTSVLDAIFWALSGGKNIQSQPVRTGEQSARISVNLGELIVTRKFKANGSSTLSVEASNGAVYKSPQGMLDDMLGALTFDPFAFTRLDAKKQLELLRSLVEFDVDLDALDAEAKQAFEARTIVNRKVKELEARVSAVDTREFAGLPSERIDESQLVEAMASASQTNAAIEKRKLARLQVQKEGEDARAKAAKLQEDIKIAMAQVERLLKHAEECAERLAKAEPLPEHVDVTELVRQIETAREINALIAKQEAFTGLKVDLDLVTAEAEALSKTIEDVHTAKRQAIAAVKMPVEGLGFGEEGVTFNGIPFDQANSATQLRVSVAVAMAKNPKLRVIRIKDGSLLDDASMQILKDIAEENDFQVWIERVDTTGKIGIVMSEGEVVAVNEEVAA